MATAALAQEKVWFDKPSYDKAERQYFERLAKVIPCKIMDNCTSNTNITNKLQDSNNINGTKSKSKKCKDNKTVENGSHDVKQSKSQSKHKNNKKEDPNTMSKIDPAEQKEKTPQTNIKEEESKHVSEIPDKNKAKQAKEEKNKADKKHRNKEKKEQLPAKEQKEQLPVKANQQSTCPLLPAGGSLANEVAKARQHIKQSLQCMDDIAAFAGVSNQSDITSRVATLEKENQDLRNVVQELRNVIGKLDERVKVLEEQPPSWARIAICPPKPESPQEQTTKKNDDNEEDIDFFASDSEGEDEEAAKIREERLAAYAAKKSKKPALIAKSNIILDVKPWDDETDMKVMEAEVRKIEMDGLLWGAAKLVPLAYSICKLQISCVVEDDKVSVDALTEKIEEIEDYVQSVDIAAFNKV